MRKSILNKGALCGALATFAVISCSGSNANQPDPYYGVDYASDQGTNNLFDSKFLAQTCGNSGALPCRDSAVKYACPTSSPCYPAQQGYANGNKVYFYNLVSMSATITPTKTCAVGATCASGSVPNPIPVSVADPQLLGGGGMHADNFPHSCTPGPAYNPVTDAYSQGFPQYPVFNALPAATTAFGAIVYPIVAVYGVTLTGTETCNDIKDSSSIADASNPGGGSYGATRTAQPTSYQLWAPIDPNTVPKYVAPLTGAIDTTYGPLTGWYQGLQVPYLNGGPIPVINNSDGTQSLAAMEGVIVDPASSSSFSDVTDNKVILLPNAPGDSAYSPIVRLHDYHLQTGQTIGTVTSICTQEPCPITSADFSKASASPYYIIFIASTPQVPQ